MPRLHTPEHEWVGNVGQTRLHGRDMRGVSSGTSRLHTQRIAQLPDDILPYQLPTSPTGIAKLPLPDNTALDTVYGSALASQALVDQATMSGTYQGAAYTPPYMNVSSWSGLYFVVGNDQPLSRVKVVNAQTALEYSIGDSGVPIPSTAVPQSVSGDTDSEAFIYAPNDVRGNGTSSNTGVYYEFWGLNKAHGADLAQGYDYTCYQMCRMTGANENYGRMFDYWFQIGAVYDDPASDPYSSVFPDGRVDQSRGMTMYNYWGALAIGANPPGACLMVHPEDILRPTADGKTGICDHPIGLEVANCQSGARWPAQRGDGTYGTDYPLIEGHWLRFAADAVMPTNLTPMGELVWRTVQKHGFIVCDKTVTCLAARWAPECEALMLPAASSHDGRDWDMTNGWAWTNFPWQDLQLLAVGSDADFHPTV